MVSQSFLKAIGKQIAISRTRANLSQVALNRMCEFPDNHIKKYELGQLNMSIESIEKICKALDSFPEFKIRKIRG